jgi:hypothetical protein
MPNASKERLSATRQVSQAATTDQPDFDDILTIYGVVNEIQRYEGEGIWSRFNIIVSLHAVLFGAVAFTYSSQPPNGRGLVSVLSIGGCLLALWATYVLRRLWLWHIHWKDTLSDIESSFPKGLPRPFSNRPARLKKKATWYQTLLLAYTQPFLITLFLVWLAIAILTISGAGFSHAKENNQKTEGRTSEPAPTQKDR